jgi:hypothetical protein
MDADLPASASMSGPSCGGGGSGLRTGNPRPIDRPARPARLAGGPRRGGAACPSLRARGQRDRHRPRRTQNLNDAHGHPAGDAALVTCARVLGQVCRPGDAVARIGGDEPAVLAMECDVVSARPLTARLRQALPSAAVTASLGSAARRLGEDLTSTVKRADRATYRSRLFRPPGRTPTISPGQDTTAVREERRTVFEGHLPTDLPRSAGWNGSAQWRPPTTSCPAVIDRLMETGAQGGRDDTVIPGLRCKGPPSAVRAREQRLGQCLLDRNICPMARVGARSRSSRWLEGPWLSSSRCGWS